MSSFFRPSSQPVSPFTPVNREPMWGIGIGYHEGLPPTWQLDYLNSFNRPILLRFPAVTQGQAQAFCDQLIPYANLQALVMADYDVTNLGWSIDHYKLWGFQLGNETELAPYYWDAQHFATAMVNGHVVLRSAGFTKPILTAGIYCVNDGTHDHAADFLSPLLKVAPPDLMIDVHWYQDCTPSTLGGLQKLLAGRPASCTEFGIPSRNPTEDATACSYFHQKRLDFTAFGFLIACAYQSASGPSDSDLDNYGLFRTDGSIKPWGNVLFLE